jgi:hypothetical protein
VVPHFFYAFGIECDAVKLDITRSQDSHMHSSSYAAGTRGGELRMMALSIPFATGLIALDEAEGVLVMRYLLRSGE